MAVWTYAHLCAVAFRSHLNGEIYTRFRLRFTVVPLVLFLGLYFSDWLLVTGVVLTVLWDVYHTAMQNFGFCRIYDSRHGSFTERGRKLDIMVNQLLYVGPIVGGLSFAQTLDVLGQYSSLGWFAPIELARFLVFIQPQLTVLLLVLGTAFLVYYVYAYWRMSQEGYRVSKQKVALLFSVGITSVWAWGFLPPFHAFFVSNFYHGLQYFGIVWGHGEQEHPAHHPARARGEGKMAGARAVRRRTGRLGCRLQALCHRRVPLGDGVLHRRHADALLVRQLRVDGAQDESRLRAPSPR